MNHYTVEDYIARRLFKSLDETICMQMKTTHYVPVACFTQNSIKEGKGNDWEHHVHMRDVTNDDGNNRY